MNQQHSQTLTRTWQISGARNSFLEQVRVGGLDDLGQPVVRFRSAGGGEPLRDLMRRAVLGEDLLAASYSPFDRIGPFREFGPVYVTVDSPPAGATPEELFAGDYFGPELVLRRYDQRHWIADAKRVAKRNAAQLIDIWLAQEGTAFIDARFSEYGCFACRFSVGLGNTQGCTA